LWPAAARRRRADPVCALAQGQAEQQRGGHRRSSRYQPRLAARARELVDQWTGVEAACRIIILEDQLAEALRINQTRDRPAGHGHRR
jgi:hypothetical protein